MPPMNWERAVSGLTIRPAAKTPSMRGTRTSPVSASTRDLGELGAERVACAAAPGAVGSSAVSTTPQPPPDVAAVVSSAQRLRGGDDRPAPGRGAHRAAGEHGRAEVAVADLASATCSRSTPSASAAIWVSTVRAPVPMSAAAIRDGERAVGVGARRRRATGERVRRVGRRRRRRCRAASGPRGATPGAGRGRPSRSARRPRAGRRRGCGC